MSRFEIEAMSLVTKGLVLRDWARNGQAVTVDRYYDKTTGILYDIEVGGELYRETLVPKDRSDIVPFENWTRLTQA